MPTERGDSQGERVGHGSWVMERRRYSTFFGHGDPPDFELNAVTFTKMNEKETGQHL